MNTSKNPWLSMIYFTAQTYNDSERSASSNPAVFTPEIRRGFLAPLLDVALTFAATWITEKPPKNTPKNVARWDALRRLSEQAGQEAQQLGFKFLTAPADGKTIGNAARSYWLEYIDTHHRPGYILSQRYEAWLNSGTTFSFWEFIGTPDPADNNVQRVKYYGGTLKAMKRRVYFGASGRLESAHPAHAGIFSTQNLSTVFSGQGWGIFVMDFDNNLYIHKHVEGKYHHSTFLSGAPVAAAGEITVEDGWVKVITAKSGHYMPTVGEMSRMVRNNPQIPGNAVIRPDFRDTVGGGAAKCYLVQDFRLNGVSAHTLNRNQVMNSVPAFARTPEAQRWFDRVPA